MSRPRMLVAGPAFRPWDLGTYVLAALSRLGRPAHHFAWDGLTRPDAAAAFVRTVREHHVGLVIGLKLDGISPAAIRSARRAGARVLLWQVDCFTPRVPRWIVPRMAEVSAVAVTSGGMVPAYQRRTGAPVRWIMEGAPVSMFPALRVSPGARRLFGSTIAFVGNLAQPPVADPRQARRRLRLVARLARHFDVRVWGPQDARAVRAARRAGVDVRRWPAYHDDLVRICRSSAIVLGTNTTNAVPYYFSNRTFLTLASGGFHVTEYVPGLEDLFTNHRHLVWFRDDEECVDVCRFYVRRPAARRRIARTGRAVVRRRWSLTGQVAKLLAFADDAATDA